MSLKIKTTPEIAAKLKDAKTFDARLFQPPHSQEDKREMQKLLSDLQNGNRVFILIHLGRLNHSARPTVVLESWVSLKITKPKIAAVFPTRGIKT